MSVTGPGGADTLLERGNNMSTLRELLAQVRASREGRLMLIGGEAGVGKTTLLREFCRAQDRDVRVLWGGCEPLRTPRPLGPLRDIVETTPGELADLIVGGAKPHEVAAALLGELRARSPTVVVLEDVHWADEATLDVLSLLAARISGAPALVLASYRDDELDRADQLRMVLGELVRRPGRLKLAPLSRAAVSELSAPYGFDGDELYRKTMGNPFFLTEILAAGGEEIPDTVRDAVLARAARLSDPARALLQAVAVSPGQVELWLLEPLVTDPGDRLEECLGSGMLRAGSAHVAFRHELARLAIEEATLPTRRIALHRAALDALSHRGGDDPDLTRLVYHAEAAGESQAVSRWAPLAAERAAASGAHREAAEHYQRALRFGDRLTLAARAELLQRRVDECYMTDQFAAALKAQEEALACYRELADRRAEGNAMRSLSRLLFFTGRTSEAEPIAKDAVELLERLAPGHELAMAYGNMAQRRMVVEELEQARAWGTRALELAQQLDDTEALVYALSSIGGAEFEAGERGGQEKLERALALAQSNGLDESAGRAFQLLAMCSTRQRLLGVAGEYVELGLEYCRDRGLDTWRLYLLAYQARLWLDLGRWDRASDAAAIVLRDRRSAPVPRTSALTTLGLLRIRRGDPDSDGPLRDAQALAESTDEIMRLAPIAAARAEQAWLSGDTTDVAQHTDAALSLARARGARWIVGELGYWRWRAGVREPPPGDATPYQSSMAGNWSRAADEWRDLGCPYETALALADADDTEVVRQAIDQLQGLGARTAARLVTRRLRQRGVRGIPRGPRPQTRQNPAGLTARELEVLTHLTEGLRNAQIAQRLVVSEKTVDHHVSAVLRKLGVQSRGEASAEARRLGLSATPPQ